MKKKNSKKSGFTLVETIVSMLVITIILGFGGLYLFTGGSLFYSSAERNRLKIVGDGALSLYKQILQFSFEIDVSMNAGGESLESSISISQEGRVLLKNNGGSEYDAFGDAYYSGGTVSAEVTVLSDECILIKITVLKNGDEYYSTKTAVTLDNLKLNNGVVGGEYIMGQAIVNPVVSFNKQS